MAPDRATRAGWACAGLVFAINTAVGLVMFFGASQLAHIFSTDAGAIACVTRYLQFVGVSEPFIGLWLILFGAMDGAGYTKWPTPTRFLVLFFVRIPLAWYLAIHENLGANGVWITLALSTSLVGILAAFKFHSGTWKLQKLGIEKKRKQLVERMPTQATIAIPKYTFDSLHKARIIIPF